MLITPSLREEEAGRLKGSGNGGMTQWLRKNISLGGDLLPASLVHVSQPPKTIAP